MAPSVVAPLSRAGRCIRLYLEGADSRLQARRRISDADCIAGAVLCLVGKHCAGGGRAAQLGQPWGRLQPPPVVQHRPRPSEAHTIWYSPKLDANIRRISLSGEAFSLVSGYPTEMLHELQRRHDAIGSTVLGNMRTRTLRVC